ncbi:MAG: hemolysin family protein [Chlamydiales bacterium]
MVLEIGVFIIALAFLTFWSGFFSGSEIALFSLPSIKIKSYATHRDPRKNLIAQLVLRPRDLLVTIFMLNTLVNILLQNVASAMFGPSTSWIFRIGVPLFITLILGEIIPKYIALQQNVKLSYIVAPLINYFTRLLKPIRELTISITEPISRALFFYLKKDETISKEELQHALEESKKTGILSHDEAELIHGYLELQQSIVKEVMRPRDEAIYYKLSNPIEELTNAFVEKECSRIPICEESLDHVVGTIDAGTFFIKKNRIISPRDVLKYTEKPFFVPESTPARLLLTKMQTKGLKIALAVDEYGSVSGIITQEDLVEEVIGDIVDIHDVEPNYIRSEKGIIIAEGKLTLDEFYDIFNAELSSDANVITLGGWLVEQMGDIPKSGASYETDDFYFQVLSAAPNKVKRVYIRKK